MSQNKVIAGGEIARVRWFIGFSCVGTPAFPRPAEP